MPIKFSPYQQHRQAIGIHTNQQDRKQGNQKIQDGRVRRLASRPGFHPDNMNRQNTAHAAVQLLAMVSAVRSSNIRAVTSFSRSAEPTTGRHIHWADNLHQQQGVEQEIRGQLLGTNVQATEGRMRGNIRTDVYSPGEDTRCAKGIAQGNAASAMQMAHRDTPSVGLDVAAMANAVTGGLTSGLKSVTSVLHQAGQFVRRYDPLTLPGAEALPAGGHQYTGRQGNELIMIMDVYGEVVDLSRDYYASANMTEPYHFVKMGLKALTGFYEDYNSKYPGLKSLARSILKEEIRRRFHLDIDPDKTQFIFFKAIARINSDEIQYPYAHGAPKKTLTEFLFSNFDARTWMNLPVLDVQCGIYDISLDGRKEYHATDAIPIKPTAFMQMVWDIDFYNRAKEIMTKNFSHRDIHVKRYFLDFINHLNIGSIDRVAARDVLSGAGLLQDNNVGVSLFDINGYSAANAFVFKNKDSGRVTLYLPRSDFKLMSFKGCFEMQSWVSNACLSSVHRDMIASHFTIADRQDGAFYCGVDAWLDSISQDSRYYDRIAMNPTAVPSEHFFDSMFDHVKSKELSDLDSQVKSDAEVSRDSWEIMIDASNILPNPVSPFLSLAMHLEHAIEADTYPEKMQEIQRIKADVANLIAMIALDKVMKFPEVEGYDFIKKVKNGLGSMETVSSKKFEAVDGDLAAETGEEAAADGTVIGCNRKKRGIAPSKYLPCAGVADQVVGNSEEKLEELIAPPAWYKRENIASTERTAEGMIFEDPAAPGRLMKFYRKAGAESERHAQNNAESFKRIYNDADVKVITLKGVDQRLYYAVEMPKINGISLSGIRATGDVRLIVAVADAIIKKDIVGELISKLQDVRIKAEDLNVGNTMFDPVTKRFNLVDFDYAETSYAVNDAHYNSMYQSLHSKIKQDFIVLLTGRLAQHPKKLERIRIANGKIEDRLKNLAVDNGRPRISKFRSAVEDFDRDNRIYVSRGLRVLLDRKDIATVDTRTLSAADGMGIRRDVGCNNYIRCDAGFLKLHRRNRLFVVEKENGNLIHIEFKDGEFHPVKITSHRGLLTSSVQQMRKDRLINSKRGFEQETNTPLNDAWTLLKVKLKNANFNDAKSVRSKIDVTFTLSYTHPSNMKNYVEMPRLEWNEVITHKRGRKLWRFSADMYQHSPGSPTFSSWRNRYIEAYHYARASDKSTFNGNVRIFDKDMHPVGAKKIKAALSEKDMARNVRSYLQRKGGVIEVTITDFPALIKRQGMRKNMQRLVNFSVGFKGKAFLSFNQGISLMKHTPAKAFVTVSKNIKLARGKVNAGVPVNVEKERPYYLSAGESL